VTGVLLPESTMSGVLAEGFQVGDRDMSMSEGLQAGVTETTLLCCVGFSMSTCDVSK
jgi:hypothetical protein